MSFADLGFAKLDLDRDARQGAPEAVLAEGKTPDEIEAIVRARGFAINRGGFRHDVGGVGTCIVDAHGRPVASINICVPLFRLEELGVDRLGALVVRAAAEVSRDSSLSAGAGVVGA